LILVHLAPPAGVVTETDTKSQCSDAVCAAAAWDVAGGSTSIAGTSRVLALVGPDGAVASAVPFTNGQLAPASFDGELASIQALGLWHPTNCGGAPCSASSTPTSEQVSASWSGVGTSLAGASVQRLEGAFSDSAADWTVKTQTLGFQN
jgi:hypothetical protein